MNAKRSPDRTDVTKECEKLARRDWIAMIAAGTSAILADSACQSAFSKKKSTPETIITRKEITMPLYLSKFSYTPETWARLIRKPEDRRTAAQTYIESVGGKLHGFWYAFGAHDGYNLWEAPDNVSMAAVGLAISAGGALSSFDTTVLLTVEDTLNALRKAEQIRYRSPGA
jgi:uncharacterized protein with GYD domain